MLDDAGMDTTIFTPYSTRSAATSKAVTKVAIEIVLKTGGWHSMRKLLQQIEDSEMFATSIVM